MYKGWQIAEKEKFVLLYDDDRRISRKKDVELGREEREKEWQKDRERLCVSVCVHEIENSLCQKLKIILKSVNNKVFADVDNDKRVFRSRGKICIWIHLALLRVR